MSECNKNNNSAESKQNTEIWLKKQQQKKNKKQIKQESSNNKKSEVKNKQKKKQKIQKKQIQKQQELIKQKETINDKLNTINTTVMQMYPHSKDNRKDIVKLMYNQMQQLVYQHDTILYIAIESWLASCAQQVHIPGYNSPEEAEIICRYSDISFLLQCTVSKLFIYANIFFKNGSILARKGSLNIVLLAQQYSVVVIGVSGSWNYCGIDMLSQQSIVEKYGPLQQYDFIENRFLNTIVLETGSTIPQQISNIPNQIYKSYKMDKIKW